MSVLLWLTNGKPYHVGAEPEIFQSRGDFVELGDYDEHFVKNTRNKGPSGKNLGVFSPKYSKTTPSLE